MPEKRRFLLFNQQPRHGESADVRKATAGAQFVCRMLHPDENIHIENCEVTGIQAPPSPEEYLCEDRMKPPSTDRHKISSVLRLLIAPVKALEAPQCNERGERKLLSE